MKRILLAFSIVIMAMTGAYSQTQIVAAEYYFDTDPGFGNGTAIPVSPSGSINVTFDVDVSGFSLGFYRLFIRTMDGNGTWSQTQRQDIFITDIEPTPPQQTPDLVEIEYYFDDDPGFGQAEKIDPTHANVIDETFLAGIEGLQAGSHYFQVRVMDEHGKWSLNQKQQINILLAADFVADTTEVNVLESVSFTNLSTSSFGTINSWQWDFDNDSVIDSNEENPEWAYEEGGLYSVSLTVSDMINTATLTKENYINVIGDPLPEANFFADYTICLPNQEIHFTDISTGNPTAWEWDFDNDGVIESYEQNPTWSYPEHGSYSVALTISTETKETSTTVKEDYIIVFSHVVINSNPVSQSICENESAQFQVSATGDSLNFQWIKDEIPIPEGADSVLILNSVQQQDSGDYRCIVYNPVSSDTSESAHLTVFQSPLLYLGNDTALCYGESLLLDAGPGFSNYLWSNGSSQQTMLVGTQGIYWVLVTNPIGCSALDSILVSINSLPNAKFTSHQSCGSYQVDFTDQSFSNNSNIINWSWDFGDGATTQDTSSVQNPSYTYSQSGFYSVLLNTTDDKDCTGDTLISIEVLSPLSLNLGTDYSTCHGEIIQIEPEILGGLPPYTYLWTSQATTLSTDSILTLELLSDTMIFLEVTDANMCQQSDQVSITVSQVYQGEEICLVTVDPQTGKNMMVWEKTPDVGITSYNIYKLVSGISNYEVIGSVDYNDYSVFIDLESDPLVAAEKYRLSCVDSCGNESGLSDAHLTMHVQITTAIPSTNVNLFWNAYEPPLSGTFDLYRGSSIYNMSLIASKPIGLPTTYTDNNPPQDEIYYRVIVEKEEPCYPTTDKAGPFKQSLSNIADNSAENIQHFSFQQGWNGMSLYLEPYYPLVQDMFSTSIDDMIILQNLTSIYWPGQNVNTIGIWDRYSGYAVKFQNPFELEIEGSFLDTVEVMLKAGWNYMPTLKDCNISVMDLFTENLEFVIYAQELIGKKVFWPGLNIVTLDSLMPGNSYKIKTTEQFSISFPECSKANKLNLPAPASIVESPWGNFSLTPNSHAFAILENSTNCLMPGDIIGAFNQNNAICGLAKVEGSKGATPLIVYGKDPYENNGGLSEGEAIRFKLFSHKLNETFELDVDYDPAYFDHGTFQTNELSVISGLKIHQANFIDDDTIIKVKIYPNPAKDYMTISVQDIYAPVSIRIEDLQNMICLDMVSEPVGGFVKEEVKLTNFHTGIYLLTVIGDDFTFVEKLLILNY